MRQKKDYGTELPLNEEAVDRCSEKISEFLLSLKTDKKELLRIRLNAENILLKWLERFGEGKDVSLACFSFLGQPMIRLKLKGDPFDPLAEEAENGSEWSRKLLAGLQTTPVYTYSNNENVVTFKLIRKRRNPLLALVIAIAAAALVSLIGLFCLPENVRVGVASGIFAPICDTYIQALNFAGIPLIFLSVLLGICGVGDSASFGRIGKQMIRHFALTLLVITTISALAFYPFFPFVWGGANVKLHYGEFLDVLLDFIPNSLFRPFLDCNAMQLILMGVAMGLALLKLAPTGKAFSKFMEDLNSILLLISQWFTYVIPLFSFVIIVKSVWAGELTNILSGWKAWVLVTGMQILILLIMASQLCIRNKAKLGVLFRKFSKTFLIAFGTNSCCATIPAIYECEDDLGVSYQVAGFGIPIGTSVYKPSTAIRLIGIVYFVASSTGTGVSLQWFVLAVLMVMMLSVAVPAIPGGVILFYPMLFSQLGLPAEMATAMIAADLFFDASCTAFCQVSTEIALAQQATALGMVDSERMKHSS